MNEAGFASPEEPAVRFMLIQPPHPARLIAASLAVADDARMVCVSFRNPNDADEVPTDWLLWRDHVTAALASPGRVNWGEMSISTFPRLGRANRRKHAWAYIRRQAPGSAGAVIAVWVATLRKFMSDTEAAYRATLEDPLEALLEP